MSAHPRRINAIKVLVESFPPSAVPDIAIINAEFDEVVKCRSIPQKPRRWLLQYLHGSRALDAALTAFIQCYHPSAQPKSLYQDLDYISKNQGPMGTCSLKEQWLKNCWTQIVEKRNRYMHEAGQYPGSQTEIGALLSDMEQCLIDVRDRW